MLEQASRATPYAMEMLDLLYRIYHSVSADQAALCSSTMSAPPVFSAEEREHFKILNWKLQNIPTRDAVGEAFQLAALIYLDRASGPVYQLPPSWTSSSPCPPDPRRRQQLRKTTPSWSRLRARPSTSVFCSRPSGLRKTSVTSSTPTSSTRAG